MNSRISSLDALRGLAALAVTCFHLVRVGIFDAPFSYGWMGVEVFFVISGFVIPYALFKANYTLDNYPRFILKRLIRLDPPYLAATAIALLLLYLSTKSRGAPFAVYAPSGEVPITASMVLLHLAYLNVFFGGHWIIGVLWTLAIEFQYYLLIGLIYPLLKRFNVFVYFGLGLLCVVSRNEAFLPHYLFLFMLGMLTFQRYSGIITNATYVPAFVLIAMGVFFTLGFAITVVATLSAVTILTVKSQWQVLRFFGNISYSLYLIHLPIGLRILKLPIRHQYLLAALALGASIVAAYVLYRLIELPAQRWASRITYKPRDKDHIVIPSSPEAVSRPA